MYRYRSIFTQLFSEVSSRQQIDQPTRRVFQPVHDRLPVFEPPFAEVAAERLQCLAVAILPVEHDHALDAQPIDENRAPVSHAIRLDGVVIGNRAADHHAAEEIHAREQRVEDLGADIVEIDVHAVRALLLQLLAQRAGLVIDAGIEAELLLHIGAFLAAAGDADGARAPDFRQLPDDAADRARGGGDHHRLAGLRLAELLQPAVGGHAGHAHQSEVLARRGPRAVDAARLLASAIELPAKLP